jgi:CRISPR-associated protein Cas2
MFIILYYDVNAKRCNKMLRICRKYLQWVQNSVFEGEISKANYEKMIIELKEKMKEEDGDSIVVYKFRTMQYVKREVFGSDKKEDMNFI